MNIIELAKEAGFTTATAAYPYEVVPIASPEQLQSFANLIIEECAKVCDACEWDASKYAAKEMKK